MGNEDLNKHANWTTADCAQYLREHPRQFSARTSKLPDFPKPFRKPSLAGGKGYPLWNSIEVINWLNKYKEAA